MQKRFTPEPSRKLSPICSDFDFGCPSVENRKQTENAISSQRRSLLGSGDRSEKIRTYNWPQNRVTDHRLEGENKNFNLDKVVEGDIVGLIEALMIADNAERMKGEIGEEA